MLDPATAQLANIQGLIELQGISNMPVIQERLKTAKRAVANAQTQLLSGDQPCYNSYTSNKTNGRSFRGNGETCQSRKI